MGIRSTVACAALCSPLPPVANSRHRRPWPVPRSPAMIRRPNPAACDPNSFNSLITGYFQGNSANPIKTFKDAMVASPGTTTARNNGFAILDSIGARHAA